MLEACPINPATPRYHPRPHPTPLKHPGSALTIIDRKLLFRLTGAPKDCVPGRPAAYCRLALCILNDDWVSLWLALNGGKKFCFDEFAWLFCLLLLANILKVNEMRVSLPRCHLHQRDATLWANELLLRAFVVDLLAETRFLPPLAVYCQYLSLDIWLQRIPRQSCLKDDTLWQRDFPQKPVAWMDPPCCSVWQVYFWHSSADNSPDSFVIMTVC